MICYVLVREDQSEHGYIDTSILGVYTTRASAEIARSEEEEIARLAGLQLVGEEGKEGEWDVGFKVEPHTVRTDPDLRYATDVLGPIAAQEIKMLGWQKAGKTWTATGYGAAIPTTRVIYFTEKGKIGRPRRVYCTQYSNAGTYWIRYGKQRLIVRDDDLPELP